jgi:2,3-bisphosphoglycerate-dependent phosphoglycerate mutase
MSDKEIVDYNIPTGIPLLYELDDKLEKVSSRYLGDQEAIRKAAEEVKRQTEAKR